MKNIYETIPDLIKTGEAAISIAAEMIAAKKGKLRLFRKGEE